MGAGREVQGLGRREGWRVQRRGRGGECGGGGGVGEGWRVCVDNKIDSGGQTFVNSTVPQPICPNFN